MSAAPRRADADLPVFERVRNARWTRRGKGAPKRSAVMRLVLDPRAYRQAHPVRRRLGVSTAVASAEAVAPSDPPCLVPPDATAATISTATAAQGGFASLVEWISAARAKLADVDQGAHGEPLTLEAQRERRSA